ncbi:MAG: hypothetical protein ABL962_07150 [Fimbriimonadaceae bacterium]
MDLKQKRRIAMMLPIVLATGYCVLLTWSSSRLLDQALGRAKAIGLPVTAEELNAAIPPDSENAAVEYEMAEKTYRKGARLDLMLMRSPQNFIGNTTDAVASRKQYFGGREVDWNDVLAVARRMEPYFQLLLKGSWKPRYHARFDWRVYPNMKATNLKDGVYFCNSAAEAAARTGDKKRALEYLQTAIRIGNHQKQEPSMIALLHGQTCDSASQNCARALALIMRKDGASMQQIEALAEEIRLTDLMFGLRSEVLMSVQGIDWMAKNLKEKDFNSSPYFWEDQPLRLPWVRTQAQTHLVDSIVAGYAIWPKSRSDQAGVKRALAKIDTTFQGRSGLGGTIANRISFGYSSLGRYADVYPAVTALTRACIRMLGSQPSGFPDKLPPPARAILDPFSGKPLLYKKLPGSFVLYSVGPNGIDNGGVRPMDICLVYNDGRISARY